MSEATSNTLVSDAELEAALAEADIAGETLPSLDESFVAVPVATGPPRLSPLPPPAVHDAPIAPAPAAPAADSPTAAARPRSISELAYRAADGVLAALDWPLRRLPVGVRPAIGLAAGASILVSLASAFVWPLIFPPPNPARELRQQRLADEARREAPPDTADLPGAGKPAGAAKH